MRALRRETLILAMAARDPRVPWYARALVIGAVAYALSPIDLVPDFIPLVGYLDDLLIIPAAVLLARRLIPPELVEEYRAAVDAGHAEVAGLRRLGLAIVVCLWVVAILGIVLLWFLLA